VKKIERNQGEKRKKGKNIEKKNQKKLLEKFLSFIVFL
jgi:hypothetical protein